MRIAEEFTTALAPLSPEDVVAAIEAQSQLLWNDAEWNRQWRVRLVGARRHVVASAFAFIAGTGRPTPKAEIGHKMADLFTTLRDEELSLFPDAHETLDRLKQLGVRLGLITN